MKRCAWPLVSILMLAHVCGCGGNSPTVPEHGRPLPLIAPNTSVVTEGGDLSLLDRTGSTFVVRVSGGAPGIRTGHIIIGDQAGGFVRRVKEVQEAPGALILETEPASLTDAVIVGEVDTTIHVGAGSSRSARGVGPDHAERGEWKTLLLSPGVAPSSEGLRLSDVTLLDGQAGDRRASITITDGYLAFDPIVETGMTVWGGSIDRLHARAEGMLRFDCDINVDIPEAIGAAGEIPLATFSAAFVHYIGPVPVVTSVTLGYAAGYEVSGAYAGLCDISFEAEAHTIVASTYRSGEWNDEGGVEQVLDASPLSCAAYADAEITVYVKPQVIISYYGEPAVQLRAVPHLDVSAETPAEPVWSWVIDGGIDVSSLVETPIIDDECPSHDAGPFSFSMRLRSGPFSTEAYVFVTSWGAVGGGEGQFLLPRGIAADAARNIYIVDSHGHRVQVFRPDSTFVTAWGGPGTGDGMFNFPSGVAIGPSGHVYVVDTDNHRIQKFLPDGTFVSAWGTEGTGDEQFKDPQGIAVDSGGDVLVTDCFTHRIQRFTADGAFVSAWGGYGEGAGEMACPMGIAVSGTGTVYVSECSNHRIQAFTAGGNPLRSWGGNGRGDGDFDCPIDVAVDEDGAVYVVDYGNDRIQVFGPDGSFRTKLGTTGNGDGQFMRPVGMAVDTSGQLYIVDSENKRVQRFAPKIR